MSSTNLPIQLTSFIGREREVVDIKRLLFNARLVTLTGAGGSGKTRLAIQLATLVKDEYQDGAWLVDLAALREPVLVPQLVAQALGVRLAPEKPVLELLIHWVESKNLLLILDNCEFLIDACMQLAQQLLSGSTGLRILATSREPFAMTGETIYPISGLACPNFNEVFRSKPQDLMQYDAMRFFVEHVRTGNPDFSITSENAYAIAEICRRLDGLPLALELASSRSNVLTPQQISERLDDRFSLLVSHQRSDPDPRHKTLRAAIEWSYYLLTPPEQMLLRRLSVFTSGFSLAAVGSVCAGEEIEYNQVLELLSMLVSKSLVVAQTLQRGEARYSFLETIREFAQEKLISSGEWQEIKDRHLQYYLKLTEEISEKLNGQYQQIWLTWLEGEYDNIRAALAWSLESKRIEVGLRIGIAMYQFWTIRDDVEEGLVWMERLLAPADEGTFPAVRANALAYASFLAGFRGNTEVQIKYGNEAATIAEAVGEEGKLILRFALSGLAYGARAAGDYQTEFNAMQRVIQLNRELRDAYQLGVTLSVGSFSAMALGEYDTAHAMLDEGLTLLREAGNTYRIAMALNFSGDLSRCEQNYLRAQTAYEESISLLREVEARRDLASALQNLGHACLHLGDLERARALFNESLALQLTLQNIPGMAECLIGFAALAVVCGFAAPGARILAAAVAIGGQRIVSAWAATRMEYEYYLALIHARMTETELQAELAAGEALSLEQAVEYAQKLPLKEIAAQLARKQVGELTVREREVAERIAQGKTNAEIADELVVSKRTVEKHIAHILIKLGATNRAQIVRWTFEASIVKPTESDNL
jgi:predicted ATPase/DNA-binding CsgD family transcriptional regulator